MNRGDGLRMRTLAMLGVLSILATAATIPSSTSDVPTDGWPPLIWERPAERAFVIDVAQTHANGTPRPVDLGITPTLMRVDDKIAPIDGHPWYLWMWRHGSSPRTPDNGGRLRLWTAASIDGPWIDRDWVTPPAMAPAPYNPFSWTGGDIVWSQSDHLLYSVPHSNHCQATYVDASTPCNGGALDSFLMSSPDGVNWSVVSDTPVLPAGPITAWDGFETGYGRLLDEGSRWVWLYRGQGADLATHCCDGDYKGGLATAPTIDGPWTKSPDNPVWQDNPTPNPTDGDTNGLWGPLALFRHEGWYQMPWVNFTGQIRYSRSRDLANWETLDVPVYTPNGPGVLIAGASMYYDATEGWLLVYTALGSVAVASLATSSTVDETAPSDRYPPGEVSVYIARAIR